MTILLFRREVTGRQILGPVWLRVTRASHVIVVLLINLGSDLHCNYVCTLGYQRAVYVRMHHASRVLIGDPLGGAQQLRAHRAYLDAYSLHLG